MRAFLLALFCLLNSVSASAQNCFEPLLPRGGELIWVDLGGMRMNPFWCECRGIWLDNQGRVLSSEVCGAAPDCYTAYNQCRWLYSSVQCG